MSPRPNSSRRRVDLRKNRQQRSRENDVTRQHREGDEKLLDAAATERVSGKGDLTRKRTITGLDDEGRRVLADIDQSALLRGDVLTTVGPTQCLVLDTEGRRWKCTIRRLLRTLSVEGRHCVVTGDRVQFLPLTATEGVIEAIEPRTSVLSRRHERREHVLAANVSQAVLVLSIVEPELKPTLIDRLLCCAEKGGLKPILCLTKADRVAMADYQSLIGVYAQLGYPVLLTSSVTGQGIDELRDHLKGERTVFAGQSGVGKSTLLNLIDPALSLAVGHVSRVNQKGRHTTRLASMTPLSFGGWAVDTPGVRQLELWDLPRAHVEGWFREFRPFVTRCRFANCQHRSEPGCAVRGAVSCGLIARTRYAGYLRLIASDDDEPLDLE